MIRVLVVDDSAFMRKLIRTILESDSSIEVVATAVNGQDGVDKALALKPDIITMDVEMPVKNGLEALREIMQKQPTPVIMFSTLTSDGARATMEAMTLGAVDFMAKNPSQMYANNLDGIREELLSKIKEIGQSSSMRYKFKRTSSTTPNSLDTQTPTPNRREVPLTSTGTTSKPTSEESSKEERKFTLSERIAKRREAILSGNPLPSPSQSAQAAKILAPRREIAGKPTGNQRLKPSNVKIIVLGVSTGGPLALHSVIPKLPKNFPVPLLIVQHMPPFFTKSLSDRLNSVSQVTVKEAADGDVLAPGTVYIAPGGNHMVLDKTGKTIRITSTPSDTLHKPSVDVMVDSVREVYGGNMVGIIMTGMGRDGSLALRKVHEAGGFVIAQNEDTCVVYGMPKAVVDDGVADEIHPLENIAEAISSCVGVHALSE